MTHTLVLHGSLCQFGKTFEISCNTPYGILQFVSRQVKGLRKFIKSHKFRLIRSGYEYNNTMKKGRYIELDLPLGEESQVLHLIPVLEGAGGDNSVGKIIIGAVIMVASVVAAPFTSGTSLSAGLSSFSFGVGGATAFSIGASIALSGISQLIAPKASAQSQERADETPSAFMSSPVNMANENGAIPIIFGEVFAGSLIINASLRNVDIL